MKLEIKQSLNKWSVGVPKEPKIAQALQMLRDQGESHISQVVKLYYITEC